MDKCKPLLGGTPLADAIRHKHPEVMWCRLTLSNLR